MTYYHNIINDLKYNGEVEEDVKGSYNVSFTILNERYPNKVIVPNKSSHYKNDVVSLYKRARSTISKWMLESTETERNNTYHILVDNEIGDIYFIPTYIDDTLQLHLLVQYANILHHVPYLLTLGQVIGKRLEKEYNKPLSMTYVHCGKIGYVIDDYPRVEDMDTSISLVSNSLGVESLESEDSIVETKSYLKPMYFNNVAKEHIPLITSSSSKNKEIIHFSYPRLDGKSRNIVYLVERER